MSHDHTVTPGAREFAPAHTAAFAPATADWATTAVLASSGVEVVTDHDDFQEYYEMFAIGELDQWYSALRQIVILSLFVHASAVRILYLAKMKGKMHQKWPVTADCDRMIASITARSVARLYSYPRW